MSSELYKAASEGNIHKVKTLLAASPELSIQGDEHPLFAALELPVSYEENLKTQKTVIFHLLLQHSPAMITDKINAGETVIHYLIKFHYENIYFDLKPKLDPKILETHNNFGQYPIHYAIMHKNERIFIDLLAIPSIRALVDWNGQNLAHHIAHYGTPEMLVAMLEGVEDKRSVVCQLDHSGNTPGQIALDLNTTSDVNAILDILEQHGASRPRRLISPFKVT